jgi:hypothetical protein
LKSVKYVKRYWNLSSTWNVIEIYRHGFVYVVLFVLCIAVIQSYLQCIKWTIKRGPLDASYDPTTCIGDLSRLWLSCLGPFVFVFASIDFQWLFVSVKYLERYWNISSSFMLLLYLFIAVIQSYLPFTIRGIKRAALDTLTLRYSCSFYEKGWTMLTFTKDNSSLLTFSVPDDG